MHDRYKDWSKQRRYDAAIEKVIQHGWTQVEAADTYGINRSHLSTRVQKARVDYEARLAAEKEKAVVGPSVPLPEERLPFDVWFERYFGSWVCPDCEVHHSLPEFHLEMIDAINSDSRRVLINLPPYHAKSTMVTVFDTVYKICYNRNIRTAIVSKSQDFAQTLVRQIQEILTNEDLYENSEGNLIADFGPFKADGLPWSQTQFIVAGRTRAEKDPTVLALGFGNQIYGRRFDEIKFDDVATLENSKNPDRVAGMLEWIDKEALSRIGKSGRAIWVGTRVAGGDIYLTLMKRPGYRVIRYSLIVDDATEATLWPEHFPYSQAMIHRSEMSPADFQLVYQNVDVPGLGASFTEEMFDLAKDLTRVRGHYESHWRMIGGVDPAGAHKDSGYTSLTVLGVDLDTGKRYLVDQMAVKAMKAPAIKQQMIDWAHNYNLYEWRVEYNGLQGQIFQYDTELIQYLAQLGVRVTPHITSGGNKWDSEFGVDAMAPLWHAELVSIPWGNAPTRQAFQPVIEEFIGFPMAPTQDRVMSWWFAELGIKDLLRRNHLPMFDARMKVPNRIRRRRRIVDFAESRIDHIPTKDQYRGHMQPAHLGFRRATMGTPGQHGTFFEEPPPPDRGSPYIVREDDRPMNVDPDIWGS